MFRIDAEAGTNAGCTPKLSAIINMATDVLSLMGILLSTIHMILSAMWSHRQCDRARNVVTSTMWSRPQCGHIRNVIASAMWSHSQRGRVRNVVTSAVWSRPQWQLVLYFSLGDPVQCSLAFGKYSAMLHLLSGGYSFKYVHHLHIYSQSTGLSQCGNTNIKQSF